MFMSLIMKNVNIDKSNVRKLSSEQREKLLKVLKTRFEKNMNRHKDIEWAKVQAKLESNTRKLWSINEMERRYKLFAEVGARNIEMFNEMSGFQALPFIVLFIDARNRDNASSLLQKNGFWK